MGGGPASYIPAHTSSAPIESASYLTRWRIIPAEPLNCKPPAIGCWFIAQSRVYSDFSA